jgi:hypothetical protein
MLTVIKGHIKYPIISATNKIACQCQLIVGLGDACRFFNGSRLCTKVTALGTFCLSDGFRSFNRHIGEQCKLIHNITRFNVGIIDHEASIAL